MSYDLGLYKDDQPVLVKKHEDGGTYVMGGTDRAELNITYNYSWFYYKFLSKRKGLRWLYGKTGKQAIPRLKKAVKELGTHQFTRLPEGADPLTMNHLSYVDYWAPTPGNAGYALNILLKWAKQHPKAIFNGD